MYVFEFVMNLWSLNLKRVIRYKKIRGMGDKKIIYKIQVTSFLFHFHPSVLSCSLPLTNFTELSLKLVERLGTN